MIKSFQRLGIIIGAITFLSSCQTYKVSLTYNPPSLGQRIIKGEPLIKLDKINDVRNLKAPTELGNKTAPHCHGYWINPAWDHF